MQLGTQDRILSQKMQIPSFPSPASSFTGAGNSPDSEAVRKAQPKPHSSRPGGEGGVAVLFQAAEMSVGKQSMGM